MNSNKILLNIINDIIDFAQIESGDFKFCFETFSLNSLLMECYEIMILETESKNLNLFLDINENIPKEIHSDYKRLK